MQLVEKNARRERSGQRQKRQRLPDRANVQGAPVTP
jgi:hypothetical protein